MVEFSNFWPVVDVSQIGEPNLMGHQSFLLGNFLSIVGALRYSISFFNMNMDAINVINNVERAPKNAQLKNFNTRLDCPNWGTSTIGLKNSWTLPFKCLAENQEIQNLAYSFCQNNGRAMQQSVQHLLGQCAQSVLEVRPGQIRRRPTETFW